MDSRIETGILGRKAVQTAPAKKVVPVAVLVRSVPSVVHWSLLLFVFTIPFEEVDLGLMVGSLSLAKISGYLFLVCYFSYHNFFSGRKAFPHISSAMWWFLGYVAVYVLNGFFIHEDSVQSFFSLLLTLVQLMALFWVVSNLLKEEKTARHVLITYSIASVVLAVGTILQLPVFSVALNDTEARMTSLGQDPTTLATIMGLAILILIGLPANTVKRFRILLVVLTVPLLFIIVQTGSRGGVLGLMIGFSVYLLPYWRSKRTWTAIILALLGIVAMVYMIANNPGFLERWQQTYYEGNLAGRQDIFPTAIEMFLERPIFGWHPIELWDELGFRLGWRHGRDAHNLFLHLLLEVGTVGTIPFLIGLGLCGRAAWRARRGNLGLLPVALLLAILVTTMSATYLNRKLLWLVLALSLAAGSIVSRGGGKPFRVLLVRNHFRVTH